MVTGVKFFEMAFRDSLCAFLSLVFLLTPSYVGGQEISKGDVATIDIESRHQLKSKYQRAFFFRENIELMLVNNDERWYAIYDTTTRVEGVRQSLSHTIIDMMIDFNGHFAYLVGNSLDSRAFISRIDLETNALVSRELSDQILISGLAMSTDGELLVARADTGPVSIFSAKTFGPGTGVLEPDRRMEIGDFGVGQLAASNDGPFLVALSNDGSLIVLLDARDGKTLHSANLPGSSRADGVVGRRLFDLATEVTSQFGAHADSVVVGSGSDQSIFIYDLNQLFGKLDFVQQIRLGFGWDFSAMRTQEGSEAAPSVLVASDDRQRVILVGSEQMKRVVVFSRLARGVEKRQSIPLAASPSDLDVSRDGRVMVVLHDDPAGSVLSVIEGPLAGGPSSFSDVGSLPGDVSPEDVATAQSILVGLGYPIGVVDGIVGPQTRRGVESFQKQSGLRVTGKIDDVTLRKLLEGEVAAARASISSSASEAATFEQVSALLRLGNALDEIGRRYNDSPSLRDAVAAYGRAVESARTVGTPAETIARALNNRCWTLAEVGVREEDSSKLMEAVKNCESALTHITSDGDPFLWAATQHSLGYALSKLGEREEGTEHLEEAVRAYEAALKVAESVALWPGADAQISGDLAAAKALLDRR